MIVATVVEQVYAKMNRAEFACSPFITIDVYIDDLKKSAPKLGLFIQMAKCKWHSGRIGWGLPSVFHENPGKPWPGSLHRTCREAAGDCFEEAGTL